ncbi:MAG: hypothetical protein HFG51_14040 [Lachnospiraceae bacterium]|nr:hypothetical protein [Lachnospiraceae bacterium]
MDKIIKIIITVLLFFMIVFNCRYMEIKYFLVGILSIMALVKALSEKTKINLYIIKWIFFYIGCGILATLVSMFNNNKNALIFINVTIFEPSIYFLLIINSGKYISYIKKLLFVDTIVIISANLIAGILFNLGLAVPEIFGVTANYGGVTGGFIKTTSLTIPILMSLIPLYMAMYSLEKEKKYLYISIGGILCAIMSMRTVFLLIIMFTPMIIMLMKILCGIDRRKFCVSINGMIVATISVFVIVVIISVKWNAIIGLIKSIITKIIISFEDGVYINEFGVIDPGGQIRRRQIKDLIYTWKFKPLLGWGDGAEVLNSSRAGSIYELSYLQILMQRGILGLILYMGCFLSIIKKAIIQYKKDKNNSFIFASTVGLITILIANATNPYLMSFDHSYIIFWNLMLINKAVFINERGRGNEGDTVRKISKYINRKLV